MISDKDINQSNIVISQYRLSTDVDDVEFEIISNSNQAYNANSEAVYDSLRSKIEERLNDNEDRLKDLDLEIDRLTNHADNIDTWVSVASGVLCGLIDIFYVGEINLDFENGVNYDDRSKASHLINNFIEKIAGKEGYTGGGRLKGAIGYLEKIAPVDQDNIWKVLGISSTKLHHLEDLAHHPTPLGLAAALCVSFLKVAIFTDKEGNTHIVRLSTSKKDLLKSLLPIALSAILYWLGCIASRKYTGRELSEQPKYVRIIVKLVSSAPAIIAIAKVAHNWALHEISDVGGSKNTPGEGMGIPGLYVSLIKELAMIPPFNQTNLNAVLSDIYSKKKVDFRSELLPIAESLGKQAIPVILNELIVSSFYFGRNLIKQYDECKGWKGIDWKKVIPYGNRTIVRMRTISAGVFTAIDLADAAIRSAAKGGVDPATFILNMALRVNIVGVGRLVIAIGNDISMGLRKSKMRRLRSQVMNEQIHLCNAKLYIKQNDTWVAAKDAANSLVQLENTANQALQKAAETWHSVEIDLLNIEEGLDNLRDDEDFMKQLNSIL